MTWMFYVSIEFDLQSSSGEQNEKYEGHTFIRDWTKLRWQWASMNYLPWMAKIVLTRYWGIILRHFYKAILIVKISLISGNCSFSRRILAISWWHGKLNLAMKLSSSVTFFFIILRISSVDTLVYRLSIYKLTEKHFTVKFVMISGSQKVL